MFIFLCLTNIKKDYITSSETVNALKGVSISFRKSEFVSILGPSGCGKTTLLNIIGGLDHYTDGDLVIGGRSTKSYTDRDWDVYRNHRVGFIFQSYNLIPHQTILGNVELALTIAGISKEERIERSKRALDRVGLAGQYYKKPNQLSGGQCQRVAIARALVNDPEILLADEPTGALDTVTSVQIMDLIKEISRERLVIMVTHNPELAEQYSSRIVRLLDGEVIEDTNPFSEEDEIAEVERTKAEDEAREAALEREAAAAAEAVGAAPKKKKKRGERAKMSFFTAFRLSARNLLSKGKRTAMVSFAGSIGIIGIAMVLAFSAGIKGYIASMQDDMLSGNPITISKSTYDFATLTGMMSETFAGEDEKEPGYVYIASLVEYLISTRKIAEEGEISNDLNETYIKFLREMDESYYADMLFNYGASINLNIYTNVTTNNEDGTASDKNMSIEVLTALYSAVLGNTEYAEFQYLIPLLAPTIKQAPSNRDYILDQYELLGENGKIATEKNEIMLVVDKQDELSDLLLARYGYYTQAEFLAMIEKANAESEKDSDEEIVVDNYINRFSYDDLLGKTFTYYPSDNIFKPTEGFMAAFTPWQYIVDGNDVPNDGAVELKVVGILSPKEDISYGCLSSGIYYTEALTEYVRGVNKPNEDGTGILAYLADNANAEKLNVSIPGSEGSFYGIPYSFSYIAEQPSHLLIEIDGEAPVEISLTDNALTAGGYAIGTTGSVIINEDGVISIKTAGCTDGECKEHSISQKGDLITCEELGITVTLTEKTRTGSGAISASSAGDIINIPGLGGNSEPPSYTDKRDSLVTMLGGNTNPTSITIYPISFDDMGLVTDYLDRWNNDKLDLTVDGKLIKGSERSAVKYDNTLEIIINLLKTMIDIISYALIAFTSISLVVSTVMIGIITYVSVVERIKEIGVIRALGGRKKDVSYLFNAETFIIGSISGLMGIVVTYILSFIANLILAPIIGYASIAALPISNALLLIALSILLTLISGLIPARSAANKDPVVALRTE